MTTTDVRRLAAARYGQEGSSPAVVGDAGGVVATLLAHRSVRRFLPEPVSPEAIATLVAAAQSAPTSSNLQTWSVVVVRDPARKDRAARLAGDQDFIREAPVLLVFVADWARGRALAAAAGAEAVAAEYLDSTLVAAIDAALAAQNAVVAAESLGFGTVYVGAVRNHPAEFADLLGLPEGAFAVAGLAVGRPDPAEPADVKPRLPQRVVRHDETYRAAEPAELTAYDAVVRTYYGRFGRPRGWIDAVVERVGSIAGLHGRDVLRDVLRRRGLPSR